MVCLGKPSAIESTAAPCERTGTADNIFDERLYFCQNWRHDVVALVTDTGKLLEQVRYAPYGEPFGLPAGDTDSDGDWDVNDQGIIMLASGVGVGQPGYTVLKDADLSGTIDAADITHANSITGGYQTLGRDVLTSTGVENYTGYAGYRNDRNLTLLYHVRHRVFHTELGCWTRRDPLGYVDGWNLYKYGTGNPVTDVDPNGLLSLSIVFHAEFPKPCGRGCRWRFEARDVHKVCDVGKPIFVQKVETTVKCRKCTQNAPWHTSDPLVYYEAWSAPAHTDGGVYYVYDEAWLAAPHSGRQPRRADAEVKMEQSGEVRVYCEKDLIEKFPEGWQRQFLHRRGHPYPLRWPGAFVPVDCSNIHISTGGLMSVDGTNGPPALWNNAPIRAQGSRHASIAIDCACHPTVQCTP